MLVTCLKKILADRALRSRMSDGTIVLKEKDKRHLMKVAVSDLDSDAVVIRLDQGIGSLSGIKDGRWKQVCDYVIIGQEGERVRVLFVEMKRTFAKELKGFEQLRRSLPFLHYLRSVCKIECAPDSEKLEVRYALIAEKGSRTLDKQRVKADRTPWTKRHEGINVNLVIVGHREPFDRLWHQ